jgi:hypothetical protein
VEDVLLTESEDIISTNENESRPKTMDSDILSLTPLKPSTIDMSKLHRSSIECNQKILGHLGNRIENKIK